MATFTPLLNGLDESMHYAVSYATSLVLICLRLVTKDPARPTDRNRQTDRQTDLESLLSLKLLIFTCGSDAAKVYIVIVRFIPITICLSSVI